jgi:hypothetical protein
MPHVLGARLIDPDLVRNADDLRALPLIAQLVMA